MLNNQYGDLKWCYKIHCMRQTKNGLNPVSYSSFAARLKKMSLHEAIYLPRTESRVRCKKKRSLRIRFISFFRKNA